MTNLTRWQWAALLAFDAFPKSAYSVLFSFTLWMIPFALILSGLHLLSLFVARRISNVARLSSAWKVATTLIVANALFAVVAASFRGWLASSGRLTECFGVERTCSWMEGSITNAGIRILVIQTAIYIALNLMSFLPFLLSRLVRRPATKVGL